MTIRLATTFVHPPIPCRDFDWCAWDDNKGEDCSLIGWGRTEEDAVKDLIEAMELADGADIVRQLRERGLV